MQVNVRTFRERRGPKDYVSVDIFVERESQKAILVGKVRRREGRGEWRGDLAAWHESPGTASRVRCEV